MNQKQKNTIIHQTNTHTHTLSLSLSLSVRLCHCKVYKDLLKSTQRLVEKSHAIATELGEFRAGFSNLQHINNADDGKTGGSKVELDSVLENTVNLLGSWKT